MNNPDVLSCLANLSSDEVFTPPKVVNAMLDMLPQDLFKSPDTTFLDPACKTGVFLREIAKRLIEGLKDKIPDLNDRIEHIFRKQLYGIAITELTGLISRRTLYCTMNPNNEYSVCKFDNSDANIRFIDIKHAFERGRCRYCGVSEENFGRSEGLESHAYEFIHTTNPERIFDMKFDVVISNPPYQMSDGGAFASASPIYQKFIQCAKKLSPKYITMIIPARWYAGGKGLDDFREEMLKDDRLSIIHDFQVAEDLFPGIRIAGGVCYFLWDCEHHDNCEIFSHSGDSIISQMKRPLLEEGAETFIRINEAIPILRKVQLKNEKSFATIVSARKPFGLPSDFFNDPSKYNLPAISEEPIENGIKIVGVCSYKTVNRYVPEDYPFPSGHDKLNKYKVFVSQVLDNGFDWRKERLKPFLGSPREACTETFLCIGEFDTQQEAENVISYMNTKFFHMLMFLKKVSHHVVAKVYQFVPMQDFSKSWTDEELYKKYGLDENEIAFIESMIRPMELNTQEEK